MLKSTSTVSLLTIVANKDFPPGPTNVPKSTLRSLICPDRGERTIVYPNSNSACAKSASLMATAAVELS